MFRYIIALLLINTCYRSLGNPIATRITVYSLDNLLKALIGRCENQFLVTQIKDKIPECNLTVPPFKSKQMQCLMFYDINSQLCDAVGSAKLIQQDDLINSLQNLMKVDLMCTDIAKTWKFTNITDIPYYKKTAEQVFHNQIQCGKVCEVADVTSDDTNNFCKYYKWGSEILKTLQENTPGGELKSSNTEIVAVPQVVPSAVPKPAEIVSANNTIPSTTKNNIANSNSEVKDANPSGMETTLTNVEHAGSDAEPNEVAQKSNPDVAGVKTNGGVKKVSDVSEDEMGINIEEPIVAQKSGGSSKTEIEKTMPEEEQPPRKDDIEKEDQLLHNHEKDEKDLNIDDIEDEADSEEEEKQDLQDNSEISIGQGDMQKMEEEKPKDTIKNNGPLMTSYSAEKSQEFISKIPQDEFPEDDDHFFSFFLTAVIIVVLLYILYHNKNKFTKVVLGLIVEGRQPGRRRNSRGHAYRRLDTLEQAMSSNNPAPPSKIIY